MNRRKDKQTDVQTNRRTQRRRFLCWHDSSMAVFIPYIHNDSKRACWFSPIYLHTNILVFDSLNLKNVPLTDIETNRETNAEKEVLMQTRFLDGRSSLNTQVLKTSHRLETAGLAVLLKKTPCRSDNFYESFRKVLFADNQQKYQQSRYS